MSLPSTRSCTAFAGRRLLISGSLADVAIAVARSAGAADAVLVFDDVTGDVVDLDLSGSDAEILQRLSEPPRSFVGRYRPDAGATTRAGAVEDGRKTRGRPKLGVVAREVTLLPRQWEWLALQPGGASAALRRLVENARKAVNPGQQRQAAQEAAYRFMQAIAGDLPDYEEATRCLFADDLAGLEERIAHWPADVRTYAMRLASSSSILPNRQDRPTEEEGQ